MNFRKRIGEEKWHWCTYCTDWPVKNYDERFTRPTSGELCSECRAKHLAHSTPASQNRVKR